MYLVRGTEIKLDDVKDGRDGSKRRHESVQQLHAADDTVTKRARKTDGRTDGQTDVVGIFLQHMQRAA